jgi:hypothetical protein
VRSDRIWHGLGADHRDVQWQVPDLSYRSLGPMFDGWRRYLAGQYDAGNRVRLIAENDTTSSTARTAAYLRFEAASNQVLGAYGFPWVCLYDRRRYPAHILEHVRRVHPLLVDPDGLSAASSAYVPPDTYLRAHPGPLAAVPPQPPVDIWVTTVEQFGAARRAAAETADGFGLSEEAGEDFDLATAEALSNALRHGEQPCQVRVWAAPQHVVLRVDDQGPGDDIATKGFHLNPATLVVLADPNLRCTESTACSRARNTRSAPPSTTATSGSPSSPEQRRRRPHPQRNWSGDSRLLIDA